MLTKYQVCVYSSDIQCKKILQLQEDMFCNASEGFVLSNNTECACNNDNNNNNNNNNNKLGIIIC
jgi:hypothetical protein